MEIRRSPDVTYEIVSGRTTLIDPAGTEIITLNPVGSMVWDALDGERDLKGLTEYLLPSLEGVTAEELLRDITDFVNDLRALGLVEES
jgi:hypothetical protein